MLLRPGEQQARAPGWPAGLRRLAESERVQFLANRPVAISSTGLRRLLAAGEDPPPRTVPRSVLQYIRKYRLYR